MPGESGTKPGAANGGAENWNMSPDAGNTAEKEKQLDEKLDSFLSKVSLKNKFEIVDDVCEKNNIPKIQSLDEVKTWNSESKQALVDAFEEREVKIANAIAAPIKKWNEQESAVAQKKAVEAVRTQPKEQEVDPESVGGKIDKILSTKMGKKVVGTALALAAGAGIFAGALMLKNGKTEEPSPEETQQEMVADDNVDVEDGVEEAENMEMYHFANNYGPFNDLEAKRGIHSFMNAGDYVGELIENGDLEVVENENGELELADRTAAYRVILYETIRMNKEQAADYLANMCSAGYFTDIFPNGCSLTEAENYLEGLSQEEEENFLQRVHELIANASFEEVVLDGELGGDYNNSMIVADGGTAENSDEAHLGYTCTNETGRRVLSVIFGNNNNILTKISLENMSITRDEDGHVTVVLRDADGNEYRYCLQCISKNERIVVEVPPVTNNEPEEVPVTPIVTPTPTPGGGGGGGGGGDEGKTDFDQVFVDAGLDGSTVTPLDQAGEVSVAPAEVAPMPVETPVNELTPEQVEAAVDGGWNGEIINGGRTDENAANVAAEDAADASAIENYTSEAPAGSWVQLSEDDLGNIYSSNDF